MKKIRKGQNLILLLNEESIETYHDLMDIAATARYESDLSIHLLMTKENINKDFLDLSTGFAGQMLQALVNYQVKAGLIGTFLDGSDSLKDFIRESNRKGDFRFVDSLDTYLAYLS